MEIQEKSKVLTKIPLMTAIFGAALLFAAVLGIQATSVNSESLPVCPSSQAVIVNPPHNQVMQGVVPLEMFHNGPEAELSNVKFRLDGSGLGDAQRETASTGLWFLEWDTTTVNNGPYELRARLDYSSGTLDDCLTQPVMIAVDNPTGTGSDLGVEIHPPEWVGPTNVNFGFHAEAWLEDNSGSTVSVTDNASFTWSTTKGTIVNQGQWADYFSGPNSGTGTVEVIASYGAQTATDTAEVEVLSSTSGDNGDYTYPDIDGDPPEDDELEDDDDDYPLSNTQTTGEQGDVALARCIQTRLGEEEYKQLLDSRERLNREQFNEAWSCFAQRQFVIPANLAPVKPDDVKQLKKHRRARIAEFKNVEIDGNKQALQLSGEAEPDSNLLIYVFSEPLVLTTQSDSDGRWTYTLEDPLEPGDHEAYVLVEADDGYQRSDGFAFAIAQADATADNPNGYGLTLVGSDDSTNQSVYLAGVGAIVLLASVFLTRYVWFKKKEPPQPEQGPEDSPLGTKPSEPPSNEIDQQ